MSRAETVASELTTADTFDDYSDIDICWKVPDVAVTEAADSAAAALSQVRAVSSLRIDPDLARSAARRRVFARLSDVPFCSRVDVDIRAESVASGDHYDAGNPGARSDAGWSAPASAMEKAGAVLKAAARGRTATVDDLLRRGCQRIGHRRGSAQDLAEAITSLADACDAREPAPACMSAEVRQIADRVLRPDCPRLIAPHPRLTAADSAADREVARRSPTGISRYEPRIAPTAESVFVMVAR